MTFIQNFPLFTIILSLFCAVISFALPRKAAKLVTHCLLILSAAMSASVLLYNLTSESGYFVYLMGHHPAPIGNEIAAGLIEPFFALIFETVILFAIIGGSSRIRTDIDEKRQGFFYIMVDLVHVALIALCYTNDIFTAFVFVEICTIASCAMLMIRKTGRALVAATRYMIFSLVGSGLFLFGVVLLYAITGQLLFPQIYEAVAALYESGEYHTPLTVSIALMVSGLAIKSGLFPFHLWMPDTYSAGTSAASSILSGVVSKGYIFLLLKVIFRAVGMTPFYATGVQYLLFAFGIAGMILGSVSALHAKQLNFMIAFSSAAQIGYIYMGIGIGSTLALTAALFQMMAHAITKPVLFLADSGLRKSAGDTSAAEKFKALRGVGHTNRMAAAVFTAASMSMIGLPIFAGFIPKLLFATSAFGNHPAVTYIVLVALSISTLLNVAYFLRTVITLYTPAPTHELTVIPARSNVGFLIAGVLLIALNVAIGLHAQPILDLFEKGIQLFISVR